MPGGIRCACHLPTAVPPALKDPEDLPLPLPLLDPSFLNGMMRRRGVPWARATMPFHIGVMCLINIIAHPPVWDDPIAWCGLPIAQVHQNPEGRLVQRCGRRLGGPARQQTGLPRTATAFGFDLNIHGAALIMVAGHEVNFRHT